MMWFLKLLLNQNSIDLSTIILKARSILKDIKYIQRKLIALIISIGDPEQLHIVSKLDRRLTRRDELQPKTMKDCNGFLAIRTGGL